MPIKPVDRKTIDWERLRPRFLELRAQGLTDNAIARELNVNEDSLHGWVWRSHLSRPRLRRDGSAGKALAGPPRSLSPTEIRLREERRTTGNRYSLGLIENHRRRTAPEPTPEVPVYDPPRTLTAALMGDPRPGRTPWA